MKKAIITTRTIITVLITIFILGFTQVTLSADTPTPVEKINALELMFVEKNNSGPLFHLKVNNTEAGEFYIKVKDADGHLLYSEKLKGVNISRKYQLALDGEQFYETFYLRFEITSMKRHETSVYNVTNKNRVINEIVVAKL